MEIDFDLSNPENELAATRKKAVALSLARLIVFILLGAVIVVGLSDTRWILLLFFPFSLLFIYLIILFNRQKDKEAVLMAVLRIREDKEKRMTRDLSSFDPGMDFMDKKHPFANDLDLFGQHSLFQLIDHTVSNEGKRKLARWMLGETSPTTAKKRHAAVEELSLQPDLLTRLEASGKAFIKEEKSKTDFYQWLKSPLIWKPWYIIPTLSGPLFGMIILTGVIFGFLPPSLLSLFILIGLFFLSWIFKPLLNISKIMPNEGDLKTYTAWARQMEDTRFSDPYLKRLQKPIYDGTHKASDALKELSQQTFMVQNRTNLMYAIFNLLFWIDFPVLLRLEKWKSRHAERMKDWEDTFAEWEAMVSLAAFTADESLSCDIFWNEELTMEMQDIKHPLIPRPVCVGNNFSLPKDHKIVLLTGSNMSGKTTFMRTLGINLVLANLGLAPFAKKFHMGPFQLFTSMRNTDNLRENVSSFYAELARIKGLLDQSARGRPIFFLLDEILKGTNTTDRIMGSEALIRQLIESDCKGVISTHDIELSELETRIPSLVNYSFHSEIKENEILFDYKIKNGPCPSFNAHKLMELMGIRFT